MYIWATLVTLVILVILAILIIMNNNFADNEPFISQYSQNLHSKVLGWHDRWDKLHSRQFYFHRYYVPFDDKNY